MNTMEILADQVPQLCQQAGVSGVAVAIVQDGALAYAQAFGTLHLETPLPVASLTKPIFAYAVLMLCERGVLHLGTPLAEYLPEPYLVDEPFLPLITAHHALSHTTGFPNWRDETGLRAAFRPGTAFHYSTEGLIYLQTVVEHLTQQPLQEHLAENIFGPSGMASSRLVPEDLSAFLPFLPGGLRAYGGTGLVTTAPDYARFLAAMVNPGGSTIGLAPGGPMAWSGRGVRPYAQPDIIQAGGIGRTSCAPTRGMIEWPVLVGAYGRTPGLA